MALVLKDVDLRVKKAIAHYWRTQAHQSKKNKTTGKKDQGDRGNKTGGKHMDGFIHLFKSVLVENGMPGADIYSDNKLEIPGFFRPTKKWDIVVVHKCQLIAALELKSQSGSVGNNFNNRTEEAIGNAQDLLTAFREKAFKTSQKPWMGTLILLEDSEDATRPVGVREPHFPAFKEFLGTSYAKRYELMLRKLVLERLYDNAVLLLSRADAGKRGLYAEPAADLGMKHCLAALAGRVGTFFAAQS
ncbi:MAG: hypothetical protein A2X36_16485 [Elusimicrobia bacterium GWA2_69_24]|nr:MAG: hypothetical protein A2X36_16485 [Elusimicrobia bacterium GWA2_69_24]HBL18429.1 restriction endonuclease [Elusimicrobiota bacterium]